MDGCGMLTFLELAHMSDATQWMGWGGMLTFPELPHIVGCYAMDGVGWDVNVP